MPNSPHPTEKTVLFRSVMGEIGSSVPFFSLSKTITLKWKTLTHNIQSLLCNYSFVCHISMLVVSFGKEKVFPKSIDLRFSHTYSTMEAIIASDSFKSLCIINCKALSLYPMRGTTNYRSQRLKKDKKRKLKKFPPTFLCKQVCL